MATPVAIMRSREVRRGGDLAQNGDGEYGAGATGKSQGVAGRNAISSGEAEGG